MALAPCTMSISPKSTHSNLAHIITCAGHREKTKGGVVNLSRKQYLEYSAPHASLYKRRKRGCKGASNDLRIRSCNLIRLPKEILLAVLEEADVSDLISLSRTCSTLRCTAILVYLRCTGILCLDGTRHKVRLVGSLPADAISALCTTPVCRRFNLDCDLVNIIRYGQRLRHLCTRSVQIPEIRVFVSEHSSFLENGPSVLASLSALLTSMTDCHCSAFLVEERMGIQSLSAIQFPKMPSYVRLHQGIQGFAASLHCLELSAAFFEAPCRWFLAFSTSPSIRSLSIWGEACTEISAHNLHTFLSHLALPHLEYLVIHPEVPFCVIIKFLSRHPQLKFLDMGGDRPCRPLTSPSDLTARHELTSLLCITSLTIPSILVSLLFKNFQVPSLEALDIWVGIGGLGTLDTALEATALHTRLNHLTLKVRFYDDISKCFRRLKPSVSLRGLEELEVDVREGLCEPTTVESILQWLRGFPSIRNLTINTFGSFESLGLGCTGEYVDSARWPSLIAKSTDGQQIPLFPDLQSFRSPWGDWVC